MIQAANDIYKQMCLKEKQLSRQVFFFFFFIHSADEVINIVKTTFVYLKRYYLMYCIWPDSRIVGLRQLMMIMWI